MKRFALFLLLFLHSAATTPRAFSQQFTGMPPSVYIKMFKPCSPSKSCAITDDFAIEQIPPGCCVLSATNGDGRGVGEVQTYEVILNGRRVVPASHDWYRSAPITLRSKNTIKVILTGEPQTELWIFISYDPRAGQGR